MNIIKKILKVPYRIIVKIAKKITNFDYVFEQRTSLENERELLLSENADLKDSVAKYEKEQSFGWPNGHFYSPVHSVEDLKDYDEVQKRAQSKFWKSIPGFSEKNMVGKFNKLKKYFKEFDYPVDENNVSRFHIENQSYPLTDALVLFAMIRDLKPKRIIEIGSGFTSALMIDINEKYFNNSIDITFIDPYPGVLLSRMQESDKKRYKIIAKKVQEVPLKIFSKLEEGDILFIDSTHVSKFNSDVNYELFNIIPSLKVGVTIHFHDVFDGFQYPLIWLNEGRAWNENYLLRAYLMGNKDYSILLMNDYLVQRHRELVRKSFTKYPNNNGGSLWIRKINGEEIN